MSVNVGTSDRIIRIIIGLGLLLLFFVLKDNARWLGLIAVIPLVTAVIGRCPVYSIFGIRTCPVQK